MLNDYINATEIGRGSFSKVYSAKHKITGDLVAIKKIRMDVFNQYRIRMMAELDIIRKLKHNHILAFHGIYQSKNNIYILSELCDGTLSTYIESNNTEKEIHDIYKQIIEGIKYLYENKIYHRDIKPENILLKDKVVKIADFGFAKETNMNENTKMSNTICGSPSYMAPELILDSPKNGKSDIWSLGVILYQMMYNRHPAGEIKNYVQLYNFYSMKKNIIFKDTYSESLNRLVKNMLDYNIDTRISWKDLFSNEWLNDHCGAENAPHYKQSNPIAIPINKSKQTEKQSNSCLTMSNKIRYMWQRGRNK